MALVVFYWGALIVEVPPGPGSGASIVDREPKYRVGAFFVSIGFGSGIDILFAIAGVADLLLRLAFLTGLPRALDARPAHLL